MEHVIIRDTAAVTVDPAIGVLRRADILVSDGVIVAIGPGLAPPPDCTEIDGTGRIAIPGLINAHTHLWQTAVRGMGLDWSGTEFHLHMQTHFVPALTPDDLRTAELVGALNLLDSGTTSVLEWCHGARTLEHSLAAVDGLRGAGIRGVFAHGTVKTLPAPGQPHYSTLPHDPRVAAAVREHLDGDDLLQMSLGVLGPDYAGIEVNRADFTLAADLDVMTTAHAHAPGKTDGAYQRLAQEGLLRTPHNLVHGTGFDDTQLRAVLEHGGSVTATSMTEINGGPPEPVVGRVLDLGGRPSIGTDSEATTATDMFAAMRESLVIQRLFDALAHEHGTRPRPDRPRLDADRSARHEPTSADALRWATLDNARALGIEHLVGSLTPGKQADIVLVRSDDLNTAPGLNPTDTVVALAHPGNVDTVLLGGKVLKHDGRLVSHTPGQVHEAMAALRATGERLLAELDLEELRSVG
ncbi:amidohydrolase family protein [uncultured Serinicoccus sp.]|uniref:amidohydrolase family protein n=1 Tax=uncultured Serinicoccus sp. TaxID=735514 RepID=UPI00260B8BD6|nr:amidohydrolase family protein [uncultured Serinicoccus sp.]